MQVKAFFFFRSAVLSCEYSCFIYRPGDYLITESNGSCATAAVIRFICPVDLSASLTALVSYFYPAARFTKRCCLLCLPPHPFLFSPPSGGVQDEENRSYQMGEAGGRGAGVQRQGLRPPSVRTLQRSHTRSRLHRPSSYFSPRGEASEDFPPRLAALR